MTVKLLGPWGPQPAGTLYTTDALTEASMVAAKVATSDLTGGIVYVPPGGTTVPAASVSSGSGGGGGGSDRSAVVSEADPVNVGGTRLLRETVGGIPWTQNYDAQGALISREWAPALLKSDVLYTPEGYGYVPDANRFTENGFRLSAAQATAIKSNLVALGAAADGAIFWAHDMEDAGVGGVQLEWSATEGRYHSTRPRQASSYWRGMSVELWAPSRGISSIALATSTNQGIMAQEDTSTLAAAGGPDLLTRIGSMPALRHTSVAAVNRTAGWSEGNWRGGYGAITGSGGFDALFTYGKSDAENASRRMYTGLFGGTFSAVGSPYASTNFIAVMAESGTDTNLQMCCKAAGTTTKVDLGASFPAFTSYGDMYAFHFRAVSGATVVVYWTAMNLVTGAVVSGKFVAGTDQLPANGTSFQLRQGINTNASATAANLDTMGYLTDSAAARFARELRVSLL